MRQLFFYLLLVLVGIGFSSCGSDDENSLKNTTWVYTSNYDGIETKEIIKFKRSTYKYTTITKTKLENGKIEEEERLTSSGKYTKSESVVYLEINDSGFNAIKLVLSESMDVMILPVTIGFKKYVKQ